MEEEGGERMMDRGEMKRGGKGFGGEWKEKDKRGERADIWSYCSHSASQVSAPSDTHTQTHLTL